VGRAKSKSLEDRVEAPEGELKVTNEQIGKLRTETNQMFSELSDEIAKEKQLRAEEYKRLDEKVKKTETGDLWLAQIGAMLLFFGVAFSSMSVELAMWSN
jgi:ribosomal protein L20